jgi:hypothetical protein
MVMGKEVGARVSDLEAGYHSKVNAKPLLIATCRI